MAKAPTMGRRAGTLHVRVIPDTRKFNRQLLAQLKRIEKQMPAMKVKVDDVVVQKAHVRRSIQRQLSELRSFKIKAEVDANLRNVTRQFEDLKQEAKKVDLVPEIDRAMLARLRRDISRAISGIETTLRPDIDSEAVRRRVNELEQEFKTLERHLHVSVLNEEEKYRIRHRIRQVKDDLDEMARDRTVRVDINPFTAWASARLAWLTRPRFVEIIPSVSRAALTKAATALAALSGARLSYDYLKRFSDWISDLDKKLPRLTFTTLGLTTAFSGLMGSISGIVGIGDGLAATLPSLLLIPGLLAGAAMSGVALFVALKDSKDELAELGDSYTNLGKIIKTSFWGEARQPIIDFSNSIMPQLERSFEKTSLALGRFTAQLAGDFQQHFADGRLEAMFDGLAASWDELAKGTDAFAGAVTNLGLVASRYMPRLAKWFVRQADTFDNWLSQVATDGRLDQWIEESIDSFYALWDVMAATTGIFQGIWKAAEAAGAGGLRGFADMLLRWEKAVNGAKWQATLTSMFRGAGDALDGFGRGLERVGNMLYEQRDTIEYFMATAGTALGDFIGDISDALSRPAVAKGMRDFIDGISSGLDSLEPALGPVADLIGRISSFAGKLAENIGPVLSTLGETAAPILIEALAKLEPHLPRMAEVATTIIEKLAPLVDKLLDAAVELAPAVTDLVDALTPLLDFLGDYGVGPTLEGLSAIGKAYQEFKKTGDSNDFFRSFQDELRKSEGAMTKFASSAIDATERLGVWYGQVYYQIKGWLDNTSAEIQAFASNAVDWLVENGRALFEGLISGANQKAEEWSAWWANLPALIQEGLADASTWLTEKGGDIVAGLSDGVQLGFLHLSLWFENLPEQIRSFFGWASTVLLPKGVELLNGLRQGAVTGFVSVVAWFAGLPSRIAGFFAGAGSWLVASGRALLEGFAAGVVQSIGSVAAKVASAVAQIRGLFPNSPAKWGPFSGSGWVDRSGLAVGSEFGDSIVKSLEKSREKVARSLGGIRTEFTSLSSDFNGRPLDVSAQFAADRAYSARTTGHLVSPKASSGEEARTTNVTANFMQPEQREQWREFTAVMERIERS